jgi:hypothetical protein
MPTDSADNEAPPEGSALPDAGTPLEAPDAGAAVPAAGDSVESASPPEAEAVEATPPEPAPETPAEAAPEPQAEAASPAPARPSGERAPVRDVAARRPARPARPPGPPRGRSDGPGVPMPEHHHLPGWVRRAHAKARPELAELLGSLQGAPRAQFLAKLEELVATISGGKFSSAWQYPEVIAEGRALQEKQRAELAEAAKATRHLEGARRRASDRLRDAAELLAPDAAARLQRALRSASDEEAIAAVEAEAMKALSTARSATSKRRDREIEKTRARIHRTLPRAALEAESPTETWQDVLRRFAEEQSASTGAGS